ncbi:hypothetical protein M758_3G165800 [Ceratodon purpureus]|nr:hypothetical protein M758_3G165800 [Ceratodon purpureus]
MRIRKGVRCVPLAATDRTWLMMKGFARGEGNASRREDDEEARREVNQRAGVRGPVVTAAAPTSHGPSGELALAGNGAVVAGTERLVDDRARRRLSADRRSRKRPLIAEGVISISSIIQAGVKSARKNMTSSPASGESVVTSVASRGKRPMDCNPSIDEKTIDQPNLLLESLKKVCSAAENTGLTAREAVAKILEQGLPGLIEGGERLIVQVAKLFRSSPAFAEREERGRYYIQETFQELMGWDDFQTGDANTKCEKTVPSNAEIKNATEAKTQLAKSQSFKAEPDCETEEFTERVGRSGTGRWVLALRARIRQRKPISPKTSPLRDPDTKLRCNRDDGKGWRCVRYAESGYSLCNYHREQIRKAENRRRKSRSKSKKRQTLTKPLSPVIAPVQPDTKPSNPTFEGDMKAATVPESGKAVEANAIEFDAEMPDRKSRRFIKAKSLKLL